MRNPTSAKGAIQPIWKAIKVSYPGEEDEIAAEQHNTWIKIKIDKDCFHYDDARHGRIAFVTRNKQGEMYTLFADIRANILYRDTPIQHLSLPCPTTNYVRDL